jgi:hypothetical protein
VGLRFIVRRGALRRFHRLKEATGTLPIDVIWDRRTSRAESEDGDSQDERRTQPAFTWRTADFVLVEEPESDSNESNE